MARAFDCQSFPFDFCDSCHNPRTAFPGHFPPVIFRHIGYAGGANEAGRRDSLMRE